jgi:hypothetical protein
MAPRQIALAAMGEFASQDKTRNFPGTPLSFAPLTHPRKSCSSRVGMRSVEQDA